MFFEFIDTKYLVRQILSPFYRDVMKQRILINCHLATDEYYSNLGLLIQKSVN